MSKPRISDDPMYLLLREGAIDLFNRRKAAGGTGVLVGCDFSRLDLRGLDAAGLDMSDGYFRMADLRGVDLRHTRMDGASFSAAQVSGAYFPSEISAEEIHLSVRYGTRVRARR